MLNESHFLIERFNEEKHIRLWNNFIHKQNKGIFLFHRDYLSYHSNRFIDHSLLVFDKKKKLVLIVPASENAKIWFSHQGLSYGGLVYDNQMTNSTFRKIWRSIIDYLKYVGFEKIIINPLPNFYSPYGNQMQEIAFLQSGAKIINRKSSFVIDRSADIPYTDNIRRAANKAELKGFKIIIGEFWEDFWQKILTPMMESKFSKKPVHSIEEITFLKTNFPQNIKLAVCMDNKNQIMAGTVIYIHPYCLHTQYIASNEVSIDSGALALLFCKLIDNYKLDLRFFDLGTANSDVPFELDEGLSFWKERLGARPYCQDSYSIALK